MNSKESLNNIKNLFIGSPINPTRQFEIIEKDLEVLEILKKYISVDIEYNQYWLKIYDIGGIAISEEEYNKLKEWLENGKTN